MVLMSRFGKWQLAQASPVRALERWVTGRAQLCSLWQPRHFLRKYAGASSAAGCTWGSWQLVQRSRPPLAR